MLLWTRFDIKRCAVSFPGATVSVVAGPFACYGGERSVP